MKARLSGAVGDCFVSTSLILNIAQASLITKLTSKFLSFALLLIMAQAASAAPVIYSITSDNLVLNNPNGSWGGDLNTGAGQNVNLTVAYWYEGNPISNSAPNLPFHLIGKQVFDNTNGLASAFISGVGPSSLDILYDFSGVTDIFSTRIGEGVFIDATGEFGALGDPLPTGNAFDMLVEGSSLDVVAYTAAPGVVDNISGPDGVTLLPGEFTFHSQVVPIPAAV